MSQNLVALLGNNLGSLSGSQDSIESAGDGFANKVVEAAQKHKIDLHSIPELKYADLNGDGKITAKEIAVLIKYAHHKRAGSDVIFSQNDPTGFREAYPDEDPNYDLHILPADLNAMTDMNVVKEARLMYGVLERMGLGMLKEIDKNNLIALAEVRLGEDTGHTSSNSANNFIEKSKKPYTLS